MVHFPSHHPARYPPPVQFPVRILPLERLPKMVGIITHFLIDYGNSHSKLLGGQQIQQSHESYPLSGGRHDIQYAFKKEKIKAPCYRKLYISWNIRYISTFPSVWYIVLFSAASHFFKQKKYPATTVRQRFIILVPAYKEDAVIHACVTSVLRQTYPAELYDLIVISDHMRPETNALLRKERISLIELHEKEVPRQKPCALQQRPSQTSHTIMSSYWMPII